MTTITLNGALGSRFLAELEPRYGSTLPRPLAELLAASTSTSMTPEVAHAITVDPGTADQLAAFLDRVLANGDVQVDAPPLLFSPRLGDVVEIVRDVLAELDIGHKAKPQWACIGRGTRGRLIDRRGAHGRVYVMDGLLARSYAYVSERAMTRVRS